MTAADRPAHALRFLYYFPFLPRFTGGECPNSNSNSRFTINKDKRHHADQHMHNSNQPIKLSTYLFTSSSTSTFAKRGVLELDIPLRGRLRVICVPKSFPFILRWHVIMLPRNFHVMSQLMPPLGEGNGGDVVRRRKRVNEGGKRSWTPGDTVGGDYLYIQVHTRLVEWLVLLRIELKKLNWLTMTRI